MHGSPVLRFWREEALGTLQGRSWSRGVCLSRTRCCMASLGTAGPALWVGKSTGQGRNGCSTPGSHSFTITMDGKVGWFVLKFQSMQGMPMPWPWAVRVCTGSDPASSSVQVPSSSKLWMQLMAALSVVTLFPWELLSFIPARLYLQTVKRDQDEHGLRHKRHLHFCMRVQSWLRLLLESSESSQEVTNLELSSWRGSKVKSCFLQRGIRVNQEELNTSECANRNFLQTWGP